MLEDTLYLTRDCPATLIPAGDIATLAKDSPVSVNQALGGSVTVTTPQGLFRIDREHWDALGGEATQLLEAEMAAQDAAQPALDGPFTEDQVWYMLKSCFDPEIPVNIVDLGLIYSLQSEKKDSGKYGVDVQMTLTAQGCGMGPTIAADAKEKIETLPEVEFANVQIVWDPPWNPRMISEEGKKKLGLE
ncbi:MAG: iron-sulfur cluster assembly protein [Verrucomicrobiota bacterium]